MRRALDGAIHAPLGISGDFGLCLHPRAPLKTLAEGVISMTRKRLFRWVLLVTLAEAAGFMVPAAGMALTAASSRPILTLVTMVLAGSVEGAVLGSAQADCLYRWRVLPARRRWVAATSVGAAVAWSLGMLPSTLGGMSWTSGTAVAVVAGGLMLLTSLPLAQYFVLRDYVRQPILWIPINMVAWLLGIAWTLLPSPWVDQSTPTGTLILVYSVSGLCMAATVATVTGLGMIRLLRPPRTEMGGNGQRSTSRGKHYAWSEQRD